MNTERLRGLRPLGLNPWKWMTIAFAAGSVAVILNCGGATATANAPAGEGQPNMQGAKSELQAARAELQAAEENKGGHRAKAIELTDKAIAEVDMGINNAGQ